MAITATHHDLCRSLNVRRGSTLLEIGEANWYGDIDPQSVGLARRENLFDVAKEFYQRWFSPSEIVSVDKNGGEHAVRLDLNHALHLQKRFGVVINHGTAEHVFNVAQVFRTMHDHCDVDGWMIHDAPFTGWIDHGFYCLHPTLFYDLASANRYEVACVAIHEIRSRVICKLESRDHVSAIADSIPRNSMLFAAFRKRVDVVFEIPYQGYYARTISTASARAWEQNR